MKEATAHLGGLDILVNNAGHLVGRCKIDEMTDDFWRSVLDVNLTTAFFVTRACDRARCASSAAGRIVNIASLAAQNGGGPGSVAYAAGEGRRASASPRGSPRSSPARGSPSTRWRPGSSGRRRFHDTFTSDEARQNIVSGVPLQREGTPEDVAGAVCFLVSDLASYLTGETLDVNGGVLTR